MGNPQSDFGGSLAVSAIAVTIVIGCVCLFCLCSRSCEDSTRPIVTSAITVTGVGADCHDSSLIPNSVDYAVATSHENGSSNMLPGDLYSDAPPSYASLTMKETRNS